MKMHHNQRRHSIRKPDGTLEEITSIRGFAIREGLATDRVSRLVNGYIPECKGYTLASPLQPKKRRAKEYVLTKEDKLFNLVMGA